MIPALMISYNRLEYTKKALRALLDSDCGDIVVIDNNSYSEVKDYLWKKKSNRVFTIFNRENKGIAYAMNQFLRMTSFEEYVIKVDNDTIVPPDFCRRMVNHMGKADLVQAKHPLIKASGVGTFDEWTSTMKREGDLAFHHFIGGSGIIFKRKMVTSIPETEWKLGGWREFQRQNPDIKKAFALDVEIELLDTTKEGESYPKQYESYYKETRRIC